MQEKPQFRLMTYNIGGGARDFGSAIDSIIQVIRKASPDVRVLQEAAEFLDADGVWQGALSQIAEAVECGKHIHFGSTISMREHMHVKKSLFVQGIFSDWRDWRKGNAILARWEFVRLGDPSKPGAPRNVPLYQPPVYEGTRDTDPRYALLARINRPPVFPFVAGTHFTTLVAEREAGRLPLPGRVEEAQVLRFKQARRLLDLLREHVLEREEVVFLLGDFNAVAGEPCIAAVLEAEGGFVRLVPANGPRVTHSKAPGPIDHILVSPGSRLLEYRCWIVDDPVAQEASDHLPVVADVKMK